MPNEPGPQEISFAQKRAKLRASLDSYFFECAQNGGIQATEIKGDIRTADGCPPREDTIRGQVFEWTAIFEGIGDEGYVVTLRIGHTPEWEPVIEIHNNVTNMAVTVFVRADIDGSIAEAKRLLNTAFNVVQAP